MVILITIALLSSAVTDLSGQWRGTMSKGHDNAAADLYLNENGGSVSGQILAPGFTFLIRDAAEDHGAISLSGSVVIGGRLRPLVIKGTRTGERIDFSLSGLTFVLNRIEQPPDSARIARLCSLIRVWGTIEYFHPWLAYRDIDWNSALVRAIPAAEASRSAAEFASTLRTMLGVLNDPETRVLDGDVIPSSQPGKLRRLVRRGLPAEIEDIAGSASYYTGWEYVDTAPPFLIALPESLRISMRTGEPAAGDPTIPRAAKPPNADLLPSKEQRLLALARWWNAIRYFYGYLDSIPSWENTLGDAIREFESARSRHEYLAAIAQLASQTHDSHSSVPEVLRELGNPPGISVRTIGNKLVVQDADPALKSVGKGDVIETIDGQSAAGRVASLMNLLPHSTPAGGLYFADQFVLAGPAATVTLRIEKPGGSEAEVTVPRTGFYAPPRRLRFGMLPGGIGYIDLDQIGDQEVDAALAAVEGSSGLILDMRGYPKSFAVPARLAAERVAAAESVFRTWHGPDPALSEEHREMEYLAATGAKKYRGRIAVLIDTLTSSRPEWECLELEAAVHPTFIGMPTRGTIGQVTNMVLPGNVEVHFSTMRMRHADGRPVQRVGIIPDLEVEPTIEGLRQGRDEIMERAVEFLKSNR